MYRVHGRKVAYIVNKYESVQGDIFLYFTSFIVYIAYKLQKASYCIDVNMIVAL